MLSNFKNSRPMQFGLLILIFLLSYFIVPQSDNSYFWRLPPLLKDFPLWINTLLDNLMFKWFTVDIWDPLWNDYEQKTIFRIITRSIGSSVLFLIIFIREIFLGGAQTLGAFFSDTWINANKWLSWPALPWTAVVAGASILGYQLQGVRLALLAGIGFAYLSIFGQWEPSMETLSFVLISAPVCFILGLGFGIWGYLNKTVEGALQPILNCMQTLPHFSYLVPVMVLFGVGDHAGAIATIIFATPPMIRLTILGLRKISPEIVDSGLMSGCNKTQLLFKVLIPTARRDILIGVNQVIMQCLAMTTIAAFIGAKGLGFNLKVALNSLEIGKASEIGLCVVLIAVILDKYSLGIAHHKVLHLVSLYEGITISKLLKKLKVTKQSLNRVLKDLIELETIIFKKDKKDSRIKHVYLSEKGLKLFNEIFSKQKRRIYKALINSNSKEVLYFNNILNKLINE